MAFFQNIVANSAIPASALEHGEIFSLDQLWKNRFLAWEYIRQVKMNEPRVVCFRLDEQSANQGQYPYLYDIIIMTQNDHALVGCLWLTSDENVREENFKFLGKVHKLTDVYGSGIYNDALAAVSNPFGQAPSEE